MGAAAALFSGAADGRQGTSKAGTQGDAERHLLDRPKDADLQDISIDSTYIKAHKASAGAERGGSQNPLMP